MSFSLCLDICISEPYLITCLLAESFPTHPPSFFSLCLARLCCLLGQLDAFASWCAGILVLPFLVLFLLLSPVPVRSGCASAASPLSCWPLPFAPLFWCCIHLGASGPRLFVLLFPFCFSCLLSGSCFSLLFLCAAVSPVRISGSCCSCLLMLSCSCPLLLLPFVFIRLVYLFRVFSPCTSLFLRLYVTELGPCRGRYVVCCGLLCQVFMQP